MFDKRLTCMSDWCKHDSLQGVCTLAVNSIHLTVAYVLLGRPVNM